MSEVVGKITAEQMLAAIDRAAPDIQPDPDADKAMSKAQWAQFWNVSWGNASNRVDRAVSAGLMEYVKRKKRCSNGVVKRLDGYIWVGPKE